MAVVPSIRRNEGSPSVWHETAMGLLLQMTGAATDEVSCLGDKQATDLVERTEAGGGRGRICCQEAFVELGRATCGEGFAGEDAVMATACESVGWSAMNLLQHVR